MSTHQHPPESNQLPTPSRRARPRKTSKFFIRKWVIGGSRSPSSRVKCLSGSITQEEIDALEAREAGGIFEISRKHMSSCQKKKPELRRETAGSAVSRAELEVLRQKTADLSLQKPQKAAVILSDWISRQSNPATRRQKYRLKALPMSPLFRYTFSGCALALPRKVGITMAVHLNARLKTRFIPYLFTIAILVIITAALAHASMDTPPAASALSDDGVDGAWG